MNMIEKDEVKTERVDSRAVDSLAFRLIVLMNLIVKPFHQNIGDEHDISLVEWRCMMWLAARPGCSGAETAIGVGMDRMNVSRSLRSLRDKSYTKRRQDDDDRKKWQWRLTDSGWKVYDAIVTSAIQRDRILVQSLDKNERAVVLQFFETATKQLRQSDDTSTGG